MLFRSLTSGAITGRLRAAPGCGSGCPRDRGRRSRARSRRCCAAAGLMVTCEIVPRRRRGCLAPLACHPTPRPLWPGLLRLRPRPVQALRYPPLVPRQHVSLAVPVRRPVFPELGTPTFLFCRALMRHGRMDWAARERERRGRGHSGATAQESPLDEEPDPNEKARLSGPFRE